MNAMFPIKITADKHMYSSESLPLFTIYDDNLFIRNDYDMLSVGQRNYLIQFFKKQGFQPKTGKIMTNGDMFIHFPRSQSNLAVSAYDKKFLQPSANNLYCVTPTQFAEVLFHLLLNKEKSEVLNAIKALIDKCPYNIEWLRDVSYRSDIEQITIDTYSELTLYQKKVVEEKFKRKKAL
jgi:hypothetical protein